MVCKGACSFGPPDFCTPSWSRVECTVCGADDVVRTKPGVAWPDWTTAVEFADTETKEISDGQR